MDILKTESLFAENPLKMLCIMGVFVFVLSKFEKSNCNSLKLVAQVNDHIPNT